MIGGQETTDRVDAIMTAAFGRLKQLMLMTPSSPAQQRQIRQVRRLCQVTADRSAHKYWLSFIDNAEVIVSLGRTMTAANAEARVLEGEAALLIDDDPLWAALTQEFTAVEGVTGRTIAR